MKRVFVGKMGIADDMGLCLRMNDGIEIPIAERIGCGFGNMRVYITIEPVDEPADAPDPILTWLEHEASDARRVLEAERDPGNIEIMRQWVYLHECLVRLRLDEMGLLDVDDEPAGGERR